MGNDAVFPARRARSFLMAAFGMAAFGALALAATTAAPAAAFDPAAFAPLGVQFGIGNPNNGGGSGTIETPSGIAIAPDGRVFVADDGTSGGRRVSAFSPTGKFLFAFGKNVSASEPGTGAERCVDDCLRGEEGDGAGELAAPRGLAVDDEAIYVVETMNSRVSVFDHEGRFLRAFGKDVGGPGVDVCTDTCQAGAATSQAGAMDGAWGIALVDGRAYVTDPGNARVDVFDAATGEFLFAFGKWVGGEPEGSGDEGSNVCTTSCLKGVADGEPGSVVAGGIALGPDGNLYTVGLSDSLISVFAPDGTYLRRFGAGPGDGAGQIEFASSLAVDGAGTVYVPDEALSRIAAFDAGGGFLAAYGRDVAPGPPDRIEACTVLCGPGKPGAGIGELVLARSVAVDCRGAVYVGVLGRVEKWGVAGVEPPPCSLPPAPAEPPASPAAPPPASAPAPQPRRAGVVRVALRAKGAGVAELARTGKLSAVVRVTFRPPGGAARTVSRKVTLVKTGYARKSPSEKRR